MFLSSSEPFVYNSQVTLGCIVIAHSSPEQVRLQLRTLQHREVRLYLHVDSRVDLSPFIEPGVILLPRYPTRWSGPEMVDAMLGGLSRAVAEGCDYVVLLTGHGFPLKPIDEILGFFAAHPDRSYGEYGPMRDRRRTEFYSYTVRGRRELCVPWGEDTSMFGLKGRVLNWALRVRSLLKGKRRFPDYLEPFGGRAWWSLSREAAEYVLAFHAEHPDYRRYHEHTWGVDEAFLCSILAQSGLEIMNDSLRYYTWGEGARSLTATPADIPTMLSSGALFAQKVDGAAACELQRLIAMPPRG
jgi:hypothetical protein